MLSFIHAPYFVTNRLGDESIIVHVLGRRIKDEIIEPGEKKSLPRNWSGRDSLARSSSYDREKSQLIQVELTHHPTLPHPTLLRGSAGGSYHHSLRIHSPRR